MFSMLEDEMKFRMAEYQEWTRRIQLEARATQNDAKVAETPGRLGIPSWFRRPASPRPNQG